jgi:hypothetical protein
VLETPRAPVYRLPGPLADHHLARRKPDGRVTLAPDAMAVADEIATDLWH